MSDMSAVFASYLGKDTLDAPDTPSTTPAVVVGAGLPADFVLAMRETAFYTLNDWLTGSSAPAEVKSLLSSFYNLCIPEFADAETVAQAARDIAALGGSFNGPITVGRSRVEEQAKA